MTETIKIEKVLTLDKYYKELSQDPFRTTGANYLVVPQDYSNEDYIGATLKDLTYISLIWRKSQEIDYLSNINLRKATILGYDFMEVYNSKIENFIQGRIRDMRGNSSLTGLISSTIHNLVGTSQVINSLDSEFEEMGENSRIISMEKRSMVWKMIGKSEIEMLCDGSKVLEMEGKSVVREIEGDAYIDQMSDSSWAPKKPYFDHRKKSRWNLDFFKIN